MTRSGDALPRLEWDELTPVLQELLSQRVERLGYLGEFFRVTAVQPDALAAFVEFTEALKRALPAALTEVIALSLAARTGNAYERHQHERLCLALGFEHRWIADVLSLSPTGATSLTDRERAVQALSLAIVDSLAAGGTVAVGDQLAEAVATLAHDEVVAVLLTVGRYLAHSAVVQTLDLAPPVASPLAAAP
jgi:Carboxymuconolactone decarboxylase family